MEISQREERDKNFSVCGIVRSWWEVESRNDRVIREEVGQSDLFRVMEWR